MRRIAIAGLAAGLGLMAAAALGATGTTRKSGGTLRVNISTSDIQSADPAIDYETFGWALEDATCLKLVNYPDRPAPAGSVLISEASSLPRVSADGKTYVFTIRPGFEFNTGEKVTAATFAYVINRDLNPKMQSPAAPFLHDVVGAPAVLGGKAKTASGVHASGSTLTIRLTEVAPDFVARMGMNFFCAVPVGFPIEPKGTLVPASAGPYYVASRDPPHKIIVMRNPNYKGTRPHQLDEIDVSVNTDANQSLLQIKSGQADYDIYGIPPAPAAALARQYGVNKGRFFVHSVNGIYYLALNTARAGMSDISVRKAINFAIDRPAIARQAGAYGGVVTDQFLPPTLRGFRDARIYPLGGPDLARAKALMHRRHFKFTLYSPNDPISSSQTQVIKSNLAAIGIDVTVKLFPFNVLLALIENVKTPYDMIWNAWFADYPDPVDFINILLDGNNIQPQNNQNTSQLNDPALNKRMEAAARLSGRARYAAYGNLDVQIMRRDAPWATVYNATVREVVSDRVGCYVFQPSFGIMDLAAACLK
jgi:ABC-type transport system substrate-binding protein